jgi:hypothetical protein
MIVQVAKCGFTALFQQIDQLCFAVLLYCFQSVGVVYSDVTLIYAKA